MAVQAQGQLAVALVVVLRGEGCGGVGWGGVWVWGAGCGVGWGGSREGGPRGSGELWLVGTADQLHEVEVCVYVPVSSKVGRIAKGR